jgi:hypothetical protein
MKAMARKMQAAAAPARRMGATPVRLTLPAGRQTIELRTDDGSLEAWVTLQTIPRGRGQRARWEARLQGASAGVPVRCTLRVDAFVRDVVPAAAFVHHADDGPLDR